MVRNTLQRAGRKNNNERIRELVALMGSLSRTGDSITIDALSKRLGISQEDARAMMDIVCQASGEDLGGLLISSNDDETEFTLQYPGIHGMPLRLTDAETIALMHALDVAGIGEGDPLRVHLQESFTSANVMADEVRKALGGLIGTQKCLYACARAQVEGRAITFLYQGLRDGTPRERKARVEALSNIDGLWYARATDLDLDQGRTFRIDRMSDVVLGDSIARKPSDGTSIEPSYVGITFTNKLYYTAFAWPGLRITEEDERVLNGEIPYYGERSSWLIRRICAGGGCITVDDEHIMRLAQEYARKQLEGAWQGASPAKH